MAQLLNRGIRESAAATSLCTGLAGHSLALALDPPGLRLRMTAGIDGLSLGPESDAPADATLSGPLSGFARLLLEDPAEVLRSGAVRIAGDTDIAERFQQLLSLARPDAEEELSRVIGDVAAHQVGNTARDLASWASRAAQSLGRSLGEYLQEERHDLPTRVEVDEFLADVDRLASDVDRAEARLRRLSQQNQGA